MLRKRKWRNSGGWCSLVGFSRILRWGFMCKWFSKEGLTSRGDQRGWGEQKGEEEEVKQGSDGDKVQGRKHHPNPAGEVWGGCSSSKSPQSKAEELSFHTPMPGSQLLRAACPTEVVPLVLCTCQQSGSRWSKASYTEELQSLPVGCHTQQRWETGERAGGGRSMKNWERKGSDGGWPCVPYHCLSHSWRADWLWGWGLLF